MLTDLPNLLTLLRIAAIPVLLGLLAIHTGSSAVAAFIVYVCACITDYFDGALARYRGQTSDLGRMMDPIADKLLVGALLLMLAGTSSLKIFSLYAAILIMLREILISGLREYMASFSVKIPSTRLAKWKTGIQMMAIGFLLLGAQGGDFLGLSYWHLDNIGSILLWISVFPTLFTGANYVRVTLTHIKS